MTTKNELAEEVVIERKFERLPMWRKCGAGISI